MPPPGAATRPDTPARPSAPGRRPPAPRPSFARRLARALLRPLPDAWSQSLAVLAVVIVAGVVNLPSPLHGDAALYQLGAEALARGRMLYLDFWDLKQPGIYLFHLAAGSLFGFTETGLHTFELLYFAAFTALLLAVLRRHFAPPWLAITVPLLTVGLYYANTSEWRLTQPAILVGPPLFLLLLAASSRCTPWRAALAGAAGGCAVLFKLAVAPVAVLVFAAGCLVERRTTGRPWRELLRGHLLPALGGAALVIGTLLGWLAAHGALEPFVWLFRVWVPLALEVRGAYAPMRALESSRWFVHAFAPWLALAACVPLGWRGLARERLFVLSAVWLAAGAVSVFAEPFAGWEFDFLLLVVPVGVLAARGLQGLLARVAPALAERRQMLLVAALLAVAGLPAGASWFGKLRRFRTHDDFAASGDHAFQRAVSPHYARVWEETAFLRLPGTTPGPIYVFGDPLIHTLSRRGSASSVHGWAWELQPEVIWRRAEAELISRRPPYIFVDRTYEAMLRERAPTLSAVLDRAYVRHPADGMGTWYVRRDAAPIP